MPASQARRLCPTAIVIPPDFTAYREKSREVWGSSASKLERLQSMGLDEAYADLTGVAEAAARPARADRRGPGATGHPDLGRRRPQPPDRQVLLGPRQARRLRRDGRARRPASASPTAPTRRAARDRPEDRRAPGRARVRHRRRSSRRPTRRSSRRASATACGPYLKAARLLRRLGAVETSAARRSRVSTRRRSTTTSPTPRSSRRSCAARRGALRASERKRRRAARSRSRCASTTGRRSRAPGRSTDAPTTPHRHSSRSSCCAPTRPPRPVRLLGVRVAAFEEPALPVVSESPQLSLLVSELRHRSQQALGVVAVVVGRKPARMAPCGARPR